MNGDNSLIAFLTSDQAIPIIAIVGGLTMAIVISLITGARSIAVARAREQTRREIAAYVAEGSMDAEQAAMLLKTGPGQAASDLESLVGAHAGSCCMGPKGKAS